jgi:hypothetical protein
MYCFLVDVFQHGKHKDSNSGGHCMRNKNSHKHSWKNAVVPTQPLIHWVPGALFLGVQ